jgi:hypothetical protein
METIEIKIRHKDFPRLKAALEKLDFLESVKIKKQEIDMVSIVAEKSLAEEWTSNEDSRWDDIL